MTTGPWQTDHSTPDYDDWQAERLAAWVAAHPAPELTDWVRRAHDRAFEVDPPDVDEDTLRGDVADRESVRVYGGGRP